MHPTGSAAPGLPPKKFRSSQHCKGGAGGAWDVENRQLKSISGASMRDPNFWKGQSRRQFTWGSWRFGIAFSDPALGNVAPALGNVVPALGNWKFWFFIFRSPDLSRSISHMRMPRITIKTHPTSSSWIDFPKDIWSLKVLWANFGLAVIVCLCETLSR